MGLRLGVDVGGTFTDLVLFDEGMREIVYHKVPSTPKNPAVGVIGGIREILKRKGIDPEDITFLIHGTTVATNAILEGKGAKTGLIVTEGFRDVLHIVRQDRPKLYDFFARRPEPLIPRHLRFEVPERVLYTGEIWRKLDEDKVHQVVDEMKRQGMEAVAVCLLHSYANPAHERRIGQIIAEDYPDARVSLSCEILPEFKEYERMSTTVINAYVMPIMEGYIKDLSGLLKGIGVRSNLHIMQSNGGVVTSEVAFRRSVYTIFSGPVGGVLGALALARGRNLITVDMGGTSFDVCLAYRGRPRFTRESEIGGHAVKVPMIDINTIGAGGGSIAWIDGGGALRVGPVSAGADPGPACYGLGGREPTVTDANLVLGRLNQEYFLGGEMEVDVDAAFRAIEGKIAKPLGMDVLTAAEGIVKVINAEMVKGIRFVSVERGYDPREFSLVCFGGGGPVHGAQLAEELGIPEVMVPPAPGVNSALGLLVADFRHDYVRTLLHLLEEVDLGELNRAFAGMEEEALDQMLREGVERDVLYIFRSVDIHYRGQGYELEVPVGSGRLGEEDLRSIAEKFDRLHERTYGFAKPGEPTEIVNLRVAAIGRLPRPELRREALGGEDSGEALKGYRDVFFEGEYVKTRIYERERLTPGNILEGPAIVEQRDSTTVIFPGQKSRVDEYRNIVIDTLDV